MVCDAAFLMALAPALLGGDGIDVRVGCVPPTDQFETDLAVDPADPSHLVAASIDESQGFEAIGWYTTFDGGKTWSCGLLPIQPGYLWSFDPCVFFDVHGGVHIVTLDLAGPGGNGIFLHDSSDGGLTFPTATLIDANAKNDKPQIAVDRTGGAGHGRIVLTFFRPDPGFWPTIGRVFVTTSSDDGQTWSRLVRANDLNVNGSYQGYAADVAIGPAGEILLEWVDADTWDVMFDLSVDGGKTFGTDRVVASITNPHNPLNGFKFDLKPVFALAVDRSSGPYGGSIYVAYHTVNSSIPSTVDVLCATSRDQGLTWSSVVVHPGDTLPTDQLLPSIAVDELGGVEATWLDRRANASGKELQFWGSRSLDGGVSFVETRIADAPFDPANSFYNGVLIGHYNALVAESSFAYACWADCRTGSDYLDVWLDRWQLDLAADASTISVGTGGLVQFDVTPGPALNGSTYLLLGSASGSTPGSNFGSVHLPLNWDAVTTATLIGANGPNLRNSLGTLDSTGSATALLDTLGPLDPALVGIVLDFATVFFDSGGHVSHATSNVSLTLVP